MASFERVAEIVCVGLRETVHATVFQVTQERTVKSPIHVQLDQMEDSASMVARQLVSPETVNVRAQNILVAFTASLLIPVQLEKARYYAQMMEFQ